MLSSKIPFTQWTGTLDTDMSGVASAASTSPPQTDIARLQRFCLGQTDFPITDLQLAQASSDDIAFVKVLLVPDPKHRLSAKDGLQCPWLRENAGYINNSTDHGFQAGYNTTPAARNCPPEDATSREPVHDEGGGDSDLLSTSNPVSRSRDSIHNLAPLVGEYQSGQLARGCQFLQPVPTNIFAVSIDWEAGRVGTSKPKSHLPSVC